MNRRIFISLLVLAVMFLAGCAPQEEAESYFESRSSEVGAFQTFLELLTGYTSREQFLEALESGVLNDTEFFKNSASEFEGAKKESQGFIEYGPNGVIFPPMMLGEKDPYTHTMVVEMELMECRWPGSCFRRAPTYYNQIGPNGKTRGTYLFNTFAEFAEEPPR